MDRVYGACTDEWREMNALTGEGRLEDILKFVVGDHA